MMGLPAERAATASSVSSGSHTSMPGLGKPNPVTDRAPSHQNSSPNASPQGWVVMPPTTTAADGEPRILLASLGYLAEPADRNTGCSSATLPILITCLS